MGKGWLDTPRGKLLAALLVAGVAILSIAPGLGGELLNWDDDRFVRDNRLIQEPSLDNLEAILTAPHFQAYHPLHLLTYIVDYQLFGTWATGYKLHNLTLYLVCLLLIWLLLRRIGLAPLPALLGLLLFASHPLHVEPVVWVSARKETLSLALMLGALLAHLASTSWRDPRRWASIVLACMALLSKTSTVVLPALAIGLELLVLRHRPLKALARTAPLWLLSSIVGLYVIGLREHNEMVRPASGAGVWLVLKTYWHYAEKLLAPLSLSPVYPIDRSGSLDPRAALGGLLLLGMGVAFWRHKNDCMRLAIGWFAIATLPVCNLVPVYFFVQDRYALLPSLALAIGAGCLVQTLRGSTRPTARRLALALVLLVTALFTAKSAMQSSIWRSSLALWSHAARTYPESYYAQLALGHTLRKAGDLDGAVERYRAAVALQPRFPWARISLCLAEASRRSLPDPRAEQIERDLRESWSDPPALIGLSAAWIGQGHTACAAVAETRAFELRAPGPPDLIAAASRWTAAGQGKVALRYLSRLEEGGLDGGSRAAYHEVSAQALLLLGRKDDAVTAMQRSLELSHRDAAALERAAKSFDRLGRRGLARFYRELASRQ
jgi:tetratricopeptide (TPR) repeat protein